ncbi:MAG: hypothetical protein HZA16_14995 [Nitrospirae bacterium]|nr:hypothetical protein [Nitrospirota bacterium]
MYKRYGECAFLFSTPDGADELKNMDHVSESALAEKYAHLFGRIAIEKGFVTYSQVMEALDVQMSNDNSSVTRPHKLIGEILFEKGMMTLKQIESVLDEIMK